MSLTILSITWHQDIASTVAALNNLNTSQQLLLTKHFDWTRDLGSTLIQLMLRISCQELKVAAHTWEEPLCQWLKKSLDLTDASKYQQLFLTQQWKIRDTGATCLDFELRVSGDWQRLISEDQLVLLIEALLFISTGQKTGSRCMSVHVGMKATSTQCHGSTYRKR